jgi:DNA-binding NarL/FixJ family response regulator
VLHPAITRKVIDRFAQPRGESEEDSGVDRLTDRELDVLKLASKGMGNKDIADHLHLSTRTVQTHLSTVFAKMGVGSRTEAVVRALRIGWISLDDTLS